MLRRTVTALSLAAAGLALAPAALAGGGRYVLRGGTAAERAQVVDALNASSFPWGIVPGRVTIAIARGPSLATPGEIRLDSGLLDRGTASWGIVQHEYAHQVDFLVLRPSQRGQLERLLGGCAWLGIGDLGHAGSSLAHGSLAGERFASELSWAFWQSPLNVLRPTGAASEAGHVPASTFRRVLARLLARG
jgi:hypothetical protein